MIKFRMFNSSDWPSFETIVEEAFARENTQKDNFLNMLEDEGLVGAFRDNKLIGYLRLMLMDNYGHLGQIAVEKLERGKGYGNQLMEYAIRYFTEHKVDTVGLYVETKNMPAINLYEKYGFDKEFESFHYWINEEQYSKLHNSHKKKDNSEMRIVDPSDFGEIISTFPEINEEELRTHLQKPKSRGLRGGESFPLGLFVENKLRVYGRFNPEFPGCKPFEVTDVVFFDDFIVGLDKYRTKEYIRLTFDRNKSLSKFCESRGYRLHHHMYLMKRKVSL
ncbi:GNAT family N-acetyltransferase [Candidatus Heimdallarchaeota archaeon]|nr:MAG: GNAT family N-acetyltransferase [Candidatus Heimdallarchaeota archaeon]